MSDDYKVERYTDGEGRTRYTVVRLLSDVEEWIPR